MALQAFGLATGGAFVRLGGSKRSRLGKHPRSSSKLRRPMPLNGSISATFEHTPSSYTPYGDGLADKFLYFTSSNTDTRV